MGSFDYNFKNDKMYNLGSSIGYFIAFLLFASIFFFIMAFFNKLPVAVRYYHVLSLVIILYFFGFLILKLKK